MFCNRTRVYSYGFNGKENDREANSAGEGTQDYGMRIYNPSLGRFLSVDPLTRDYPWYTPYQFAGNKPIRFIDLDGAEEWDNSGTFTSYIRPLPYNGDAGDIMNFLVNNTIIALYNSASGAINAIPASVSYLNTPGNSPTTAAVELSDVIERHGRKVNNYFKKTNSKQMFKDAANSFTQLENYDLAAQLVFTHYLTKSPAKLGVTVPIETQRYNLAIEFYSKYGESNIVSKLSGINFNKAVQTRTLKAGTIVEQWVNADGTIGKYFAPIGSDASKLGINTEGRSLKQFTLTSDVKVLESTAADYYDKATGNTYKGGGIQYFNPEIKNNIKPVETP